ncbi:right-handed parallel beta-helix repeat-containing protein, partial [Myxococcota bacterium]
PTEPCPWGHMEILGYEECQPIGDCGTGTWGNIQIDATTVFVDATADATAADGSQGAPFTTIQDAYYVVQPGGQIAVAAGEYEERLLIDKEVRLTGRCAELVTIRGTWWMGVDYPPVRLTAASSDTTLSGLTLTGDVDGLHIDGAQGVTLTELQMVDAGSAGIWIQNGASASLSRAVIAGCTEVGINSYGADLTITETVVRDTAPGLNDFLGTGIQVECGATVSCGSLSVNRTLVWHNYRFGMALFGVPASVVSSVIRNTQRDQGGIGGHGILARCDQYELVCGSLEIASSLVVDNATYGLVSDGSQTTVTGITVRDTQQTTDGDYGVGILALCYTDLDECGSLDVSSSFVSSNHKTGVSLFGVETAISSTVIKDTEAMALDGTGGVGLAVQCAPYMNVCGPVSMHGSQVIGNRSTGIAVWGADASIHASVVSDTRTREVDQEGGRGIVVRCEPYIDVCGGLALTEAVITANHADGVYFEGVDGIVTASVTQTTLANQASGVMGVGISAACSVDFDTCGSLAVEGSVSSQNRMVGLVTEGVDTQVTSTVISETAAQLSDGKYGYGLAAQCHRDTGTCASMQVEGSLITRNHEIGLATFGTEVTVSGSIVRDTMVREGSGEFGRGCNFQCDDFGGPCGQLSLVDTLVHQNQNIGVFVAGVPATLIGVSVTETRPNEEGTFAGDFGQGVFAMCNSDTDECSSLEMTACLVGSSFTAGVALQGETGFIESSVITGVQARPDDGSYGYGIQVEGLPGAAPTSFDVRSCLIQDTALAGILYHLAGGMVSGTQIAGGQYTVVMNQGANPFIEDDNDLSGALESEPTWANMDPSPAPDPLLPIGM